MSRGLAVLFSVLVLGAVLAPLLRHPDDDSYPLSTYPMFSHGRASPVTSVTHVVAVDAAGARTMVPPIEIISAEVLLAQVTIARAVNAGPASARRFCMDVADRITRSRDPKLRATDHVEVETTVVDAVRYLAGDQTPIERTVHARCRAKR